MERIGIVGVGRLGSVLARRLATRYEVLVWDQDPEALRRAAARPDVKAAPFEKLGGVCGVVLLCVPAGEVLAVLREAARLGAHNPLYLSLATAVSSDELGKAGLAMRLRVAGVKVVGQFTAIEHGLPALFVTSHEDAGIRHEIQEVLGDLGEVVAGEEDRIAALNRTAARLALQTGATFAKACEQMGIPSGWQEAALRNVLVGTLLDYPPETANSYTRAILEELAEEAEARD